MVADTYRWPARIMKQMEALYKEGKDMVAPPQCKPVKVEVDLVPRKKRFNGQAY